MGSTYEEIEVKAKEAVDTALADARAELMKRDFDKFAEKRSVLTQSVNDWNAAIRHVLYEKFMESENPIITAIRTLYVTAYRVVDEHDEDSGKIIGVKIAENKRKRIDIEDFVNFKSFDKTWLKECDELLALLQLRKTDIYNMTVKELASASGHFIEFARKKKEGETPDSNTQLVKKLQSIVDATIYEDNGKGLNKHKCTAKDIIFIEDCAHSFDPKAKAGIKSLKSRQFQTVMVSVLYSMLTGEGYTVKNAKIKSLEA